jgi:integrase
MMCCFPKRNCVCAEKATNFVSFPWRQKLFQLLDHYLQLEHPSPCSAALFVVLKGCARGTRMNAAELRSLFRHHRQTIGIMLAHPHRFRHTFASDMVRAGMSLPALTRLIGHADIQPLSNMCGSHHTDIYLEYARAVLPSNILWLQRLIAPSILSVLHSAPIRLVTTAELSENF